MPFIGVFAMGFLCGAVSLLTHFVLNGWRKQ